MPMLSCSVQDNMLSRRNMFLDRLEDAKRENKDKTAERWSGLVFDILDILLRQCYKMLQNSWISEVSSRSRAINPVPLSK